MNVWKVFRELLAGKGMARILMNLEIGRSVELSGIVLDVGGKGKPSYLRFLRKPGPYKFIVLDIVPDDTVDIVGSAACLPIKSNSCDIVLCFNVLEHVFDFQTTICEIKRVLKSTGVLYGYVPFLVGIHADPLDCWRYTKETLIRLLKDGGFEQISVQSQGGLFFVLFDLLSPFWRVPPLRLFGGFSVILLNHSYSWIMGDKRNKEKYPLGYFFTAKISSLTGW